MIELHKYASAHTHEEVVFPSLIFPLKAKPLVPTRAMRSTVSSTVIMPLSRSSTFMPLPPPLALRDYSLASLPPRTTAQATDAINTQASAGIHRCLLSQAISDRGNS